jgi:exosome complex component RRP4|tara:strand:+ start:728 stop:1402 length:675 start_codon:yes stop_codon:yes gene_type:complete
MSERKIVIPGEVIVKGDKYLPGEGTEKQGDSVVALRYGLAEETKELVKVISLSGPYMPRRGNVVIGTVENTNFNGWFVDLQMPEFAFLPVSEVPGYINKNEINDFMGIGSVVIAKIRDVNKRGIDLTIKSRGLGRLEDGMILKINPHKVPRIIGKEGSMVNLIKEETGCNITVGQNGAISISGDKVEDELLAKKAILSIVERAYMSGLTDEMKNWFDKEKKNAS